jgi:hypothetical protein
MIRRGFWLVAGAAIGVAGYRKASRLARALAGPSSPPRLTQTAGAGGAPWPVRVGTSARSAAAFVRDVREGMADYRAEHAGPDPGGLPAGDGASGPAGHGEPDPGGLPAGDSASGPAGHRGPDPAGDRVRRGAPGPASDGALHDGRIGRSLGSRSPQNLGGRAQPGASRRGPREH